MDTKNIYSPAEILKTFSGEGVVKKPEYYLNKTVGIELTITGSNRSWNVIQHNVSNEKYFGAEIIAKVNSKSKAKKIFDSQVKLTEILYK